MDDVSIWLILSLLVGLSLWIIYGITKNDIIIIGGNLPGVILNLILLALKKKFSKSAYELVPIAKLTVLLAIRIR